MGRSGEAGTGRSDPPWRTGKALFHHLTWQSCPICSGAGPTAKWPCVNRGEHRLRRGTECHSVLQQNALAVGAGASQNHAKITQLHLDRGSATTPRVIFCLSESTAIIPVLTDALIILPSFSKYQHIKEIRQNSPHATGYIE